MNAVTEAAREPRKPTTFAINLEESWQSRWWCEHFGVSPTELLAAIVAVGIDAGAVREALDRRQTRSARRPASAPIAHQRTDRR